MIETIKDFKEQFDFCAKEVSMDGLKVDSHSGIPANVYVYCENNDNDYYISGIEIGYLGGFGCPSSINIKIRQDGI